MRPTLVVLAGGLGQRFGGPKQLAPMGPHEESLFDYAVFDAIEAGFGKLVVVVSEALAERLRQHSRCTFADRIDTHIVIQSTAFRQPELGTSEREKPWGTGHALLCTREVVNEPFAVVNADDFYGGSAFADMARFLTQSVKQNHWSMIGYQLNKTLSLHGSVARGICSADDQGMLVSVTERSHIEALHGHIVYTDAAEPVRLPAHSTVSMNFWGFHPAIFDSLSVMFSRFVQHYGDHPSAEFYLPKAIDELVHNTHSTVQVLPSDESWYGLTYPGDVRTVRQALATLTASGHYTRPLWSR